MIFLIALVLVGSLRCGTPREKTTWPNFYGFFKFFAIDENLYNE